MCCMSVPSFRKVRLDGHPKDTGQSAKHTLLATTSQVRHVAPQHVSTPHASRLNPQPRPQRWKPGKRVHCTARNASGTKASWSRVPSTTTDTKNSRSVAIKCE